MANNEQNISESVYEQREREREKKFLQISNY